MNKWTSDEEKQAIDLLRAGLSCKEVAEKIKRSVHSVSKKNFHKWHLPLKEINYGDKLSRSLQPLRVRVSQRMKGKWAGENNPNYGAKIVKRGLENPLSVWKLQNPGYQNGEKNPSYGRIPSSEEIKRKTRKLIEFNNFRKGKTYPEIYGVERALEISKVMGLGAAVRISKQKYSGTTPEIKIKEILEGLGIKYKFQYPIEFYCVDFFIPDNNIVIQVDGCYWHGCPTHFSNLDNRQRNRQRLDHSCDSFLKNRGYKVLRIWECSISRINIESKIKSTIKEEKNVCLLS